ncbi:hypothetical protein M426DRAFT_23501 [Hypoxylon sp. CI-4A]|nr:hypothetical protein M426DRAFT_23501 [Hypoxylon sp. CI-4A]
MLQLLNIDVSTYQLCIKPSSKCRATYHRDIHDSRKMDGGAEILHESDGFFETARNICESSAHSDRNSLLGDIYFCLGAVAVGSERLCHELHLFARSWVSQTRGCIPPTPSAASGVSRTSGTKKARSAPKEALRIRKAFRNYIPRFGEANMSYALSAQGKFAECDVLPLDSLAVRLGRNKEAILSAHKNEIARTTLLKGKLFGVTGKAQKASVAPRVAC